MHKYCSVYSMNDSDLSANLTETGASPPQTDRSAFRLYQRARIRIVLIVGLGLILLSGLALVTFIGTKQPHVAKLGSQALLPPLPKVEETRLIPVAPEAARELNKEHPFVPGAVTLAKPFQFLGSPLSLARATDCLAAAVWYEAGDDPPGESAVAQVILNRSRHPAFPATICGVVFQGATRRTGCQFTFACDGALRRTPSAVSWTRARAIAGAALAGAVEPAVGNATHYHADYVVPYWRDSLDKISQVHAHIFYKWKGVWGKPAAFQSRGTNEEPVVPVLGRLSNAHKGGGGGLILEVISPEFLSDLTTTVSAQTPVPLPSPIAVAGVTEKALRGAVVRGQSSDANRFTLQLEAGRFPGSYATAAVALCKGRPTCSVLGWLDPTQMADAQPLSDSQRDSLTFVFLHSDTGGDKAFWNCLQIERSNKAQCLPSDPIALAALIR